MFQAVSGHDETWWNNAAGCHFVPRLLLLYDRSSFLPVELLVPSRSLLLLPAASCRRSFTMDTVCPLFVLMCWNLCPVMTPPLHTYTYLKHTSWKHQPSVSCLKCEWKTSLAHSFDLQRWAIKQMPSQCVVFKSSGKGFQVTFPTKLCAAHHLPFSQWEHSCKSWNYWCLFSI